MAELESTSPGLGSRPQGGIPGELIRDILDGRCVAFVGAGFSAAAKLPDWVVLLRRVAADSEVAAAIRGHVEALLEGPKPSASKCEQAAQLLEDELTRPRFVSSVARHLLSHAQIGETMQDRMRFLREIPFRAILTTNFDGFLSGEVPGPAVYKTFLRPERHRWWDEAFWGGERMGAPVLKLHGDLESEHPDEHLVLTRRDYRRRLYGDPGYMPFLHAMLTTNTVLFMGTSFEDAYLNELRSQVLALFGYQTHERPLAYALQNDVHELTRQHFDRHEGIGVLNFESDGGRDFAGFDHYLQQIWSETAIRPRFGRLLQSRRLLWVDPSPANNHAGYRFLQGAAQAVRSSAQPTIVEAESATDAMDKLVAADGPDGRFDLIISHWGHDRQTAMRLLDSLRSRADRPPLIVFGNRDFATENKPRALRAGALAYCSEWETLFRTISETLKPGRETR
ncbi:MAG: SIR2 family protein [Myxococcales bacterium]|nr:SIR2 family protein [Myxococcales bacterium]